MANENTGDQVNAGNQVRTGDQANAGDQVRTGDQANAGDRVLNTNAKVAVSAADEARINYTNACRGTCDVTLAEATSENVLSFGLTERPVHVVKDVPYKLCFGPQGLETLMLDVLVPDPLEGEADTFPLLVWTPGGGFMYSHEEHNMSRKMRLAQAGYVVASIHVRCVPDVVFPSPLEDAKAAIRFLRANASDYHIDVDRVGALGDSSGGYFASMLGATSDVRLFDVGDHLEESSAVSAVAVMYPVCDLTLIGFGLDADIEKVHHSPAATEGLFINGAAFPPNGGGSVFDDMDATAKASPYSYITEQTPPFLIFHGDQDTTVSPVGSMVLYKKLLEAGVPAERYVVAGAPHGGPKFDQPQVMDKIVAFFDRELKGL